MDRKPTVGVNYSYYYSLQISIAHILHRCSETSLIYAILQSCKIITDIFHSFKITILVKCVYNIIVTVAV